MSISAGSIGRRTFTISINPSIYTVIIRASMCQFIKVVEIVYLSTDFKSKFLFINCYTAYPDFDVDVSWHSILFLQNWISYKKWTENKSYFVMCCETIYMIWLWLVLPQIHFWNANQERAGFHQYWYLYLFLKPDDSNKTIHFWFIAVFICNKVSVSKNSSDFSFIRLRKTKSHLYHHSNR